MTALLSAPVHRRDFTADIGNSKALGTPLMRRSIRAGAARLAGVVGIGAMAFAALPGMAAATVTSTATFSGSGDTITAQVTASTDQGGLDCTLNTYPHAGGFVESEAIGDGSPGDLNLAPNAISGTVSVTGLAPGTYDVDVTCRDYNNVRILGGDAITLPNNTPPQQCFGSVCLPARLGLG